MSEYPNNQNLPDSTPPNSGTQPPQYDNHGTPDPSAPHQYTYQQPVTPPYAPADNTKLFSILAYIPFLWLVGLLADRNNPRVMFHVNQGILFTIAAMVLGIATGIISAILVAILPILVILTGLLNLAVSIVIFIWFIIGIINASSGAEKPLPVIGTMATIIK